jgi:GNAT superfamily N-acetyltransferase
MKTEVLPATPDMAERISALIQESFTALSATDWEHTARQVFIGESSPAAIGQALIAPAFAAVETEGNELSGFILMRKPALLTMLFVHPEHLRKGIARRLWQAGRSHIESTFPEVKTVELNSTPYAVNAYKALGFMPISSEFAVSGCRATRMACWLPARGLGVEAP